MLGKAAANNLWRLALGDCSVSSNSAASGRVEAVRQDCSFAEKQASPPCAPGRRPKRASRHRLLRCSLLHAKGTLRAARLAHQRREFRDHAKGAFRARPCRAAATSGAIVAQRVRWRGGAGSWHRPRRFHLCDRAPKVRRMCSSVEASSSCVASRVASPRSQRRVAARLRRGPALERVAQPRRVLGDVGVKRGEQRDGAAHEVGDDAPDLGVGDILAVRDRGEPDRAVGLGPVEPARHGVGHARPGAAARGRLEFVLALGAEPLEQRDVDVVATAEVVVHEPRVTPAALAMSSIETSS